MPTGKAISSLSTVTVLTDGTLGTATDALAEITDSYVEATIADALASLAAKVNTLVTAHNSLIAEMKARGWMDSA